MVLKTNSYLKPTFSEETEGEPLILAENLGIRYEGEKQKRSDVKSIIHDLFTFKRVNRFEPIWALNGVSFAGYPGDVLGVIGPNGAGKTTLCRTILGLLKPDIGNLQVYGKVTSMLSLGTGFNEEISGRENIRLNGLMLGLSGKEIEYLLPSIENFTGLGRFLGHPLKYYSSGMRARLGFSIAAALESEILVIDEVLGTGDLEFKERALNRMHELVRGAAMVVVVTHDIDFVEENCSRVLWLDKGCIIAIGDPREVAVDYRKEVAASLKPKKRIINLRETRTEVGQEETIRAENLGVSFKLGKDLFWALHDINFSVYDKEILGLIGPNGAGKTTLCRTLSGLYRPDRGFVQVKGDVTALLSFNLGFNNELTGYDNIYLNGMMLGIPKKVIRSLEKDIIEFAELEKVIHRPVKEYSSGMKSRLGFSIAAILQPDVLVVDEALSAGDLSFREKATTRMQDMLEDAKTVVLVTHSLSIVETVCTRAIWLNDGAIRYDGDPRKAVNLYKESVKRYRKMKKVLSVNKDSRLNEAVEQFGAGEYEIAEDLLSVVLRDYPNDLAVLSQYAEIAEACENWSQAKERWGMVVREAESSANSLYQKALKRLTEIQCIIDDNL